MRDFDQLLTMTQDEIGLDAYVMFPDSRRSIPDTVLWAFASACLIEYVKPLIDLKGLGEKSRHLIEELLQRWRSKRNFEELAASPELTAAVKEALTAASSADKDIDRTNSISNLAQALTALGIRAAVANRHAEAIADLVSAHQKK